MKRGFLFGLGSFWILAIIGFLVRLLQGHVDHVALILVPVSAITIRAANRAPPNRSRWHAVGGWFLGFFAPNAVLGIALVIWMLA